MQRLSKTLVSTMKLSNLFNKNMFSLTTRQLNINQSILKLTSVPQFRFFGGKKTNESGKEEEIKSDQKQETEQKTEVKQENKKKATFEELLKEKSEEGLQEALKIYQQKEAEIKKLNEKIAEQDKQTQLLKKAQSDQQEKLNELRSALKTQIEDTELTRKRLMKEKDDAKIFSITSFAKDILDVQDNLQRAIDASKSEYEGKDNALYEGTLLTYKVLEQTLKRYGVEEYKPLGKKFDPNRHEALVNVQDPKVEDGHIAFIAQTGYIIGERILRPAKVGVAKK